MQRMPSIFYRTIHAHDEPDELRSLLHREWSSIAVVAGLIVVLQGTAALGNSLPLITRDQLEQEGYLAIRYTFLALNIIAYISASSSSLIALFLLHTSNAVPRGGLHTFLLAQHTYLMLPLISLFVAVAASSFSYCCATLFVYDSWWAFGVRSGIGVLWQTTLAVILMSLKRATKAHVVRRSGGAERGGGGRDAVLVETNSLEEGRREA